jgi:hypothetical protein
MVDDIKYKPCPFCGNSPIYEVVYPELGQPKQNTYLLECRNKSCHAMPHVFFVCEDTVEEKIGQRAVMNRWNQRND